jgi:hypothetical protein
VQDGAEEVTAADLAPIVPLLWRLVHANPDSRARLHQLGLNVVPANFYSATPTIQDISTSFEYTAGVEPPYLDPALFDNRKMREVLDRLRPFAAEFQPPLDASENDERRFFWNNPLFSYSDAMAYYCFLRCYRPATVVEIGSGFSTLVAVEALRRNGTGRVVCVEPFPRAFLRSWPEITLVEKPAQEIDAGTLNGWLANDGDVLFIDSTHTVKTGGDCPHIYLRLLPILRRRVLVHVHDVFLPHGMPKAWLLQHHYWTEQYLLLALLTDNPRAEVLYGSAYHEARNPDDLAELMGGKYQAGGASFWFAYQPRAALAGHVLEGPNGKDSQP